jgi:5-methyltetrahydrofolate--homocysteine methyltransferase
MSDTYTRLLADKRAVIFDGAMGTEIQKAGVVDSDYRGHAGCSEMLNITRPDVIESIHAAYLTAGATVVETNTFGASRPKLDEYGLGDRVIEINRRGAQIARAAVDGGSWDGPRLVCGSIGPTGYLPSSTDPQLGGVSFDSLASLFAEQAQGLIAGGADILLIETSQDLLEVRAAAIGIQRACAQANRRLPMQIQATMDTAGHMLLGSDIAAFLGAAAGMGATALGCNCSAGPAEMLRLARQLLQWSETPVAMIPNAGMPRNVDGAAVYDMAPDAFAAEMVHAVRAGVRIVGGCCGTSPEHIAALAHAVADIGIARRERAGRAFLGTGISGRDLESEPRPFVIGERLNTQGSRKTRELVRERNFDELYHSAREQIARGAAVLDICMASNETEDEGDLMEELTGYLSERVGTPLCIDTTEAAVLERALKRCPGAVMINSINLEENGRRAHDILPLARRFGCAVIGLTIDDAGMADSVERKLAVARRLRDIACEQYGLPEHMLYIDPLIFTLATGDRKTASAAHESLAALREIKRTIPGVRTVMGVSNVSYGLKPASRRILNNVLLHHAAEAGLDAAIFNPLHRDAIADYDPVARERAEDLLFDRRPDALTAFVEYFEQRAAPSAAAARDAEHASRQSPRDRLYAAVLERDKRSLEPLIDELLQHESPEAVMNDILLPAMAEVGARMSSGDMILPFVLQAAEVMKSAVTILEPHMSAGAGGGKGKVVLATVYGDVHDIGKNLVGSILRNQGYDIVDLGKQVAVETIVDAVKREAPDCLGLSALLVTTSQQMAACVKAFDEAGLAVPVLIGGAAVNRDFAARIAKLDNGQMYAGGVHFAKDAFEASAIIEQHKKGVSAPPRTRSRTQAAHDADGPAPEPVAHGEVLVPPFYGTGDMLTWKAEALLDSIDRERLYKGYWRGGNLSEEEYQRTVMTDFEPAFDACRKICAAGAIDPRGFYGFFPVYASETRLFLVDPSDFHTELISFDFPRMTHKHGRSIAEYFRPEADVIAAQAVTIGGGLSERSREFFQSEDRYAMGFYLNGLGNYLTETLAEKVTREIRRALYIDRDQGRRYSFGYPGMPGLEEQSKLFELMCVEDRLGVSLTPGYQMEPEHSTLALFVHNGAASY